MAADDAIVKARMKDLVPNTIHFYTRAPACVSVGYFEKISNLVDTSACKTYNVKICRRRSGGGTIFTDDKQLIYAICIKDFRDVKDSFKALNSITVETLKKFGVDAKFVPENDVLVNGKKISGSAQIRYGNTILQHGTILIDFDFEKASKILKSPGVKESLTTMKKELGFLPETNDLKKRFLETFSEKFEVKIEHGDFILWEKEEIRELLLKRYENPLWNFKR